MLYWAYWKDSDRYIVINYPAGHGLQDVANKLADPEYPDIILCFDCLGVTTKRLGVDYFKSKHEKIIAFCDEVNSFRDKLMADTHGYGFIGKFIVFIECELAKLKGN